MNIYKIMRLKTYLLKSSPGLIKKEVMSKFWLIYGRKSQKIQLKILNFIKNTLNKKKNETNIK